MIKKLIYTTSLKANIAANFVGNGWVAIMSIVFVPVYLKYIGAEGYGLIGVFASLQIVLSLLDSSLTTTLNKELASLNVLPGMEQRMRNIVRTLGNVYWVIALIAGLIAIGLSPLMAKHWVVPQELSVETITYAFMLLGLSLLFQFPSGFYSGGLLGLQRQVMVNAVRIVFATLRPVGAVVVLIFISKSILAFFAWTLLISAIQAFVFKYALWHYLPKANHKAVFDRQELKNIRRFAAGMMGISLTAILLTQIDKIILSKILPLEQFGYYTIGCTLALMIMQLVTPLSQSYFPKLSSLISLGKIDELKNVYHQGCQMISALVLPATCILVIFSKELILIWTNSTVVAENTWLITAIYAFGTGINGLMTIPFLLTISYGWTKLGFYQNLFFLILMIPLTIYFALNYGAVGGALSWATINALYFLITPHLVHHRFLKGEAEKWYWHDTLLPFLGCITVVALSKWLIFSTAYNRWVELLLIILVGFMALVVIILLSNKLRQNILNILKMI